MRSEKRDLQIRGILGQVFDVETKYLHCAVSFVVTKIPPEAALNCSKNYPGAKIALSPPLNP